MEEIWKDIKGYEGLYQVSNLGRVKSLGNGNSNRSKLKIMKTTLSHKGYPMITLRKDDKSKTFSVHRLVAIHFIPNPDNLPQVNHIDEVKTNNRIDNLEWCTNEYNHNYGTRIERVRQKQIGNPKMKTCLGKFGKDHHTSKPIVQLTMDGKLVRIWFSAADAIRENGYDKSSVSSCCTGKRKTAYGYKWMHLDDYMGVLLEQIQNEDMVLERAA